MALPPTTPTNAIRDLQFQSGDPASILSTSGGAAQNVASNTPSTKFVNLLMGLLQKYQTLGTKPFVAQQYDAQQAQNDRILAPTPASLIGATPGQQSSVVSAESQALNPTIQGAQQSSQTFGQDLSSFGTAVGNARQFLSDYNTQQNQARDDARAVINQALTLGGAEALKGLDAKEISALEKNAGYPAGWIHGVSQTLKERELQLKLQTAANKPATVQQQTYANYAPRLESADQTINTLTPTLMKLPTSAFYIGTKAPSFLQGSDLQSYSQAKTNFINAVLRQESGAAISDTERASYDAQYFPQPGDSQAVIAQKAQNRAQVIASYRNAAGTAYTPPVVLGPGAPAGAGPTMRVRVKATGQTGSIPTGEFDASVYDKL